MMNIKKKTKRKKANKHYFHLSSISLLGFQDRSLNIISILNPLVPLQMLGQRQERVGTGLREKMWPCMVTLVGESAPTSLILMRKTSCNLTLYQTL